MHRRQDDNWVLGIGYWGVGLIGCHKVAQVAVASCLVLAVTAGGSIAAPVIGPVDLSGGLGYSYRALSEGGDREDSSHQLLASLNATNYFWEPWLATSRLSLTFASDSSESRDAASTATTDARLVTGDWSLALIPDSKTPFNLQYQRSDSRIDRVGTGEIPITFVGEDYSSSYLGLRQSYITDNGGRYQARIDLRSWDSRLSGGYDDTLIGVEADLRLPKNHFIARSSYQTNEHSLVERTNKSMILDLSDYYYPVRGLRVDSRASLYDSDRSFLDPTSSDTRLTTTNIAQASSFLFWRPENSPLSVSGGVRVLTLDGAQGGVAANDQMQTAVNAGAFYFYNNNIRFDASLTSTFRKTADLQEGFHRQHIATLYQTDWYEIAGFMYQAYANAAIDRVAEPEDDYGDFQGMAGHNLSTTWWLGERTSPTSVRLSLNEALRYQNSGAVTSIAGARQYFDNSATVSFNQRVWGGDTLALLTLSDSRELGGADTQQMVHLQLSRGQDLGRRSSITGDVTLQYVGSEFDNGLGVSTTDTTTSTARVSFSHSQLLGVPRLGFTSDYMISKISTEGAIDRQDWDNRVIYTIGKLDTSMSYRLTETDMRNYDLVYFRVMRRF